MPTHRDKNPGCFSALLRLFGASSKRSGADVTYFRRQPGVDPFPYRIRDDFLSPAEHSLYQVLKNLFGDKLTICPKVSLSDIFYVKRPDRNMPAYNRINQKYVDFLVCRSKTMKPLFAIELDDRSHGRSDRIDRDAFVDGVF